MNNKLNVKTIIGCGLFTALLINTGSAQTFLTTEHVDIGLAEGSGLGLHWHDEDNAVEYEPNQAVAYIDPVEALAGFTIPSTAEWDFLGGAHGGNIWVLPQSSDPNVLFLGIGAEDTPGGVFDLWNPGDSRGANTSARWIELSLLSYTGPGDFSMWQASGPTPTAFMSTATILAEGNRFYVEEGGHDHVNWGFTALGTYDLTFQVRSFIGTTEVTDTAVFQFTSVPEPSIFAFLMISAVAFLARRRRIS